MGEIMDQRLAWPNEIYRNYVNLEKEKGKNRANPLIGDQEIHKFFAKYLSQLGGSSRKELDPSKFFTKKTSQAIEKVMSQQEFVAALKSCDSTEEGYFFIKYLVVDFLGQNLTIKNFDKMLAAAIKLHLYSEFKNIAQGMIGRDPSKSWLKLLSKEPKNRKLYFETSYSRGDTDLDQFSKIEPYRGLGQVNYYSNGYRHLIIHSTYCLKMILRAYLFPKDFVTWFDSIENVHFQIEVCAAINLEKDKDLIEILVKHIDFGLNAQKISKSVLAPLIIDAAASFYKNLVSSLEVTARNAGYNDHTLSWKEKAEAEKTNVETTERPQFFKKFFGTVVKNEGGVVAMIEMATEMARGTYYLESKEDGKEPPTLPVYRAVLEALASKKVLVDHVYDRYSEIVNNSIQFDEYSKGYALFVGIDLASTDSEWTRLYDWLVDLMISRQNLITSMANEFSGVRAESYQRIAEIVYQSKIKLGDLENLWVKLYQHRGSLIFGGSTRDELVASKFLISLEFAMLDLYETVPNSIKLEELWKLIQKQQVLLYDNYNVLMRIDDHIYLRSFSYLPAIFKENWRSALQEQWYNFSNKKRFVLLVAANLKANGIKFSDLNDFFTERHISLNDYWQETNNEDLWRTNSQKAVKAWIQRHIGDEFK